MSLDPAGGMVTLLVLAAFGGIALRIMTPDERKRLLQKTARLLLAVKEEAARSDPDDEQFRAALRHRTPWLLLTPAIVAASVLMFFLVPSDKVVNLAPRTTNGEWWRLATSLFVHSGFMPLLIDAGAIVCLGLLLERLAGRLLCAGVFVAAGVFASIFAIRTYPLDASMGASGAICGWIGLLIASWLWSLRLPSDERIPARTAVRVAAVCGIFLVISVARGDVPLVGDLAGLATGLVCGAVLARRLHASAPSARAVAWMTAAAAALAAVLAFPVRGVTDITPEIAKLISLEDRTAAAYQTAAKGLKKGDVNPVVRAIEQAIVPQLTAAEAHWNDIHGIPSAQQQRAADAREYLRRRADSWRLRADSLRQASTPGTGLSRARLEAEHRRDRIALGKAESAESASLAVLARLR